MSHRVWAGGGGPSEWESFHLGREEESLVFRVSFENLCEGVRLGKRLNWYGTRSKIKLMWGKKKQDICSPERTLGMEKVGNEEICIDLDVPKEKN